MRKTLFIPFLAGLIYLVVFGHPQMARSGWQPSSQPQRSNSETHSIQPDRKPLESPFENPRIMVHKAARKLELYSGDALRRTYRIGLGFSPVADKRQAGDGATPEGDFYVFIKNNRSAYYLSLGVSYPNVEDAERGLRDGLINRLQYNSIVRANTKKRPRLSNPNSVG